LFAWALPVVLATVSVGLLRLLPGMTFQAAPQSPLTALPMTPMVSACVASLAGGIVTLLPTFGEELGFRGFLQRELEPVGFWTASLVTSLAWAVWHLPVTLETSRLVGSFPLHLLLLGPFLAVLQSRARSVLAPSLFHATLNGAAAIPALFVSGGSDLPRWLATHAPLGVCLLFASRITHSVRPAAAPVART
jgi:membrane protease YdiL (CAAX protease family)